jgi:hypothetical protein
MVGVMFSPLLDAAISPGCSSSFHRERGVTTILSKLGKCFVSGCEEVVIWTGWWYCVNGMRHQAESCDVHSDHADFTPTLITPFTRMAIVAG